MPAHASDLLLDDWHVLKNVEIIVCVNGFSKEVCYEIDILLQCKVQCYHKGNIWPPYYYTFIVSYGCLDTKEQNF